MPWSNGLVERHHTLIARNVKNIVEESNCRIETALAWAVNAKNSLSNINGFSPYQLLLGCNPVLPSLSNPLEHPTTLEEETVSERVAEHISAMYNARKQQMAAEADEKIRRALVHKTRDVYSKEIKQGDSVFYKRNDSERWKGPATVIGFDNKQIFVRHGGLVKNCDRSRIVNVNEINKKSDKVKDPPPRLSTDNTVVNDDFCEIRQMIRNDVDVQEVPQPESNGPMVRTETNDEVEAIEKTNEVPVTTDTEDQADNVEPIAKESEILNIQKVTM